MTENKNQLALNFNTGQSYLMAVGDKKDFIVYNVNDYELSNDLIADTDLVELEMNNKKIDKLKSEVWSSNCRWFFVLQDEGIYLFDIYSKIVWLCKKHSTQFIEMYLNK